MDKPTVFWGGDSSLFVERKRLANICCYTSIFMHKFSREYVHLYQPVVILKTCLMPSSLSFKFSAVLLLQGISRLFTGEGISQAFLY